MTYDELVSSIKAEYPKFKVVEKSDSALMKVIDFLLKLITFWQQRAFLTTFTTTVGYTVYVPDAWLVWSDRARIAILRHERVHMSQKKRLGFWFSVSYLLLWFPCLWAYFRMKYEMEAYEESMRVLWEYQGERAFTADYRFRMIRHFTTAEYCWTWPWKKRIEKWYDGVAKRMQS